MNGAGLVIDGDGVAALCCAHLLSQSGISFFFGPTQTGKQPAIMLGSQAASLLKDVARSSSLLDSGWPIERRVVLWGDARDPITVTHDGIAISEEALVNRMRSCLSAPAHDDTPRTSWRIVTRNAGQAADFSVYGERSAVSYRVKLKDGADMKSCWIESTPRGWLFLLPFSESEASLISAGYDASTPLEQSRLIAPLLEEKLSSSSTVSISPCIARSLYEEGLILAGSAAMRFDPLCGEGAGHAVREAYLAVAVIRAAGRGQPVKALLEHYEGRLRQAFLRHLAICSSFYRTGGSSVFWCEEGFSSGRHRGAAIDTE